MPEIEEQQRGNGCFDLKNERIYDDYDVLPFDCYGILIYINVFFFEPETKINHFDFSKNQKEPFYYWPAAFVSLCFLWETTIFLLLFSSFCLLFVLRKNTIVHATEGQWTQKNWYICMFLLCAIRLCLRFPFFFDYFLFHLLVFFSSTFHFDLFVCVSYFFEIKMKRKQRIKKRREKNENSNFVSQSP